MNICGPHACVLVCMQGFECPVLVTLHLIALMQGLLLLNLVPMCFPVRLDASKARDPPVWTRRC